MPKPRQSVLAIAKMLDANTLYSRDLFEKFAPFIFYVIINMKGEP